MSEWWAVVFHQSRLKDTVENLAIGAQENQRYCQVQLGVVGGGTASNNHWNYQDQIRWIRSGFLVENGSISRRERMWRVQSNVHRWMDM
jgi:hypothetical protein